MLWALGSGIPAFADDTELFVSDSNQFVEIVRPNILFIMDTSGSMDNEVESQGAYEPKDTYTGDCSASRVYWRNGTGGAPNCSTNQWFNDAAFMCDAAIQAFAAGAAGYVDLMAQYDNAGDARYENLDQSFKDRVVECEDDRGVHGDGRKKHLWASDDQANEPWTTDPTKEVPWGSNLTDKTYTVYDGNYLNWLYGATTTMTRLEVVQDVVTGLLGTLTNVNVGLMRLNQEEGGPVVYAMEDIATARQGITDAVNAFTPGGWTPLSEVMYEAGQYYAGRNVDYGDANVNEPLYGDIWSVDASRTAPGSTVYNSPIDYGCQKNFVVMLTDGQPTRDISAEAKIDALPDFRAFVPVACTGNGDGECLDDMAQYLFGKDLDPDLPGLQNVVTYTIGFTINLPILALTARKGGGEYHLADDTATLATALSEIVTSILQYRTTFTAPAVGVNSFNRTRNVNDIFISLFEASGDVHWPGNLKRYRLRVSDNEIVDVNGDPAVDPLTGFFADTTQSYWSAGVDGADTILGGAANQIPDPAARNVYTYLAPAGMGLGPGAADPNLSAASNHVVSSNTDLNDWWLRIGQPGDPTRDELIDYIRGVDVPDTDKDADVTEPRNQMGDPLHARPVSIVYGGTVANPDPDDAVIYFATNDGYLHAIDPATGAEKWSFIPTEFIGDQIELFHNNGLAARHYGIDGNLAVQILDNDNGVVEPGAGDKVYIYFGKRRGGSSYHALDVTDPDAPKLMWTLDNTSLPGVGQSWSTPIPTRIDILGAAQNAEKMVLVFGGGYDTSHDNYPGNTDTKGNAIYIVDSVSGALLWHASDAGADRNLAEMQYSIPSDVRVIDMNTGGAPVDPSPVGNTRRFYYAPDVALVNDNANNFVHIGIGSGHRAHPNSELTQDRFYALRDHYVFGTRTQAEYDALTPVTDADLMDITNDVNAVVPVGSPGWRFELRDGGWIGEKVLAEARTFDNQIFFTTFTPGGSGPANTCQPVLGTNRLYVMDILNGAPVNNMDEVGDPDNLTETDRYQEFRGSIASEVVFLFPSPDDPDTCVGDECTPPPLACVGLFCFPPGFANNPMMTFWSQESVQ
jgi:type IV pilus assembly protein PilY1